MSSDKRDGFIESLRYPETYMRAMLPNKAVEGTGPGVSVFEFSQFINFSVSWRNRGQRSLPFSFGAARVCSRLDRTKALFPYRNKRSVIAI